MAWASKEQYAILMNSEKGKDLAEKIGDMTQEEFEKAFSFFVSDENKQSDFYEQSMDKVNDSYFDDFELKEIDIDKVIEDNDLDDKKSTDYHRHGKYWNDNFKNWKFNKELDNVHFPIYAIETVDGKYELGDGKHRIIALKNSGIKKVKIPVKKIEENNVEN